jgi:hypothetical protein
MQKSDNVTPWLAQHRASALAEHQHTRTV